MPRVGIKPTTPVFEREKVVDALGRAVTVIGNLILRSNKNMAMDSGQEHNIYKLKFV
jgi:hypothetical protein